MAENLRDSALGMVFRMSRVFGVAPVTFSRTNVHLSRRLMMCSSLFFTIINIMLLVGLVFDFEATPRRRIRVQRKSSAIVWVAFMTNMMLVSAVGVYFAPSRIQCINKVLASVNKMKRKIEEHKLYYNKNSNLDTKLRWSCMFLNAYKIGLIFGDIYEYIQDTMEEDREVKVLILYTGFYYESFCFTLFEYQFIAVATEVRSVLKMITNGLEELLKTDSGTQHRRNLYPVNGNNFQKDGNVISINRFIDNMPAGVLFAEKYSEKREIIIHDLAKAYGDTCDLIRDVNDGFGLQLLLILMSYFLELIVTPYYLMTSLTNRDRDASYIVLQVFWALYHLTDMYYIIEPAYLTQLEIEKIEYLICRHVRQVKPHEALYVELKMFRRQLAFTRPTYSPMGVCTLSRQFCLSMLGCVTTYLVIILQFRANEG